MLKQRPAGSQHDSGADLTHHALGEGNTLLPEALKRLYGENGSLSRIRTYGQVINSHLLYR
jgi:hypothetical protein